MGEALDEYYAMRLTKNENASINAQTDGDRFIFHTPSTLEGGAQKYCVGVASEPHRFRIFEGEDTTDGWTKEFEFFAYSKRKSGTIPFAVGDYESITRPAHRFWILENTENADKDGWNHQFVFWAYPGKSNYYSILTKVVATFSSSNHIRE